MIPPFLVIRPGQAFWVDTRPPDKATATPTAFAAGCYTDTRWYDRSGGVWRVIEARLSCAPSFLARALQRRVGVELRFGPRAEGDVTEALRELEAVLRSDNEFCQSLRHPAAEIQAQFAGARTIAELVDIACRLESD